MLSKKQILEYLVSHKQNFSEKYNIDVFAIYGSYARDEANENSDIDIAYKKCGKMTFEYLLEAEELIQNDLHAKVDLVDLYYMNPIVKMYAEKDFVYVR